jgi:hypothetical protein
MKAVIFAACCALVVPALARAQDASGRWEATFQTQQGTIPATMILKKDGDKLSGTISSAQGEAAVSGTQKGPEISLSLTMETSNGPLQVLLTATQKGESLSGVADVEGQAQVEWSATRAAAPGAAAAGETRALDVSGTWVLEVTTPAGSGTPTVTFKQEGEKLTGQYSGQLGEAPLTGTLKGNAITFQFDADVQGTALRVVYTGTVEQAAMKGGVRLGDAAEGTFVGRRKK